MHWGWGRVVLGSSPSAEVSWGRRGLVPRMVVRARWWRVWQIRTWAKSLLPRWLGLSLKEKKKIILDGKKNEITVCQREIDRSGRDRSRFFFFFFGSSFKTGKAKGKNSHKQPLRCPVCSQRGTLAYGTSNFFLPCQAGLLRDEDCATCPSLSRIPFPGRLALEPCVLRLHLNELYSGSFRSSLALKQLFLLKAKV